MTTLWDLLMPARRQARRQRPAPPATRAKPAKAAPPRGQRAMQAKYDAVVAEMLETHGVRVRKWRTAMSGIAWYVTYKDGRVVKLIESPRPKGPMSAAIFLHEIGHHAIGFDRYKPRCLEEYHAWAWSLRVMEEKGLNVTDGVRHRMHASLWYAVEKAKRRGIRAVPPELEPYLERPVRRTAAAREKLTHGVERSTPPARRRGSKRL